MSYSIVIIVKDTNYFYSNPISIAYQVQLSLNTFSAPEVRGPVGSRPTRGVVETLERHDGLFGRPSGVTVVGGRAGIHQVRLCVRAGSATQD